jgi:peptidyl-prolyl cis-trans isomerase D
MLNTFRAKTTSIFFWVIVVLLIIGLAGFGISTGGIATQNVARVGDREISRETFVRTFDQEIRAITQQLGRPLPTEEARRFGVDRFVLSRLVNEAALDHEADRLGLSTGDDEISRQIRAIPAFQGLDGSFDREAYRFALERTGLSIRQFEEQVRREATRELVAASLQAPAAMPDVAGLTVLGFLGERRAFSFLRLGEEQLEAPIPEPAPEELRAFHGENPERYSRPETREITYARVTLEDVAATIEVGEAAVDAALEAQPGRFETPERRYLDRIGFATEAEARAVRERLDAGEITFDQLAAERELTPADIDQGLLAAYDLAPQARDEVFGMPGPGVVGPVATPLGPSLYRINGIVAGRTVPADEARAQLREELALSQARDRILDIARELEDMIAGGASIEEVAAETPLVQGQIGLNDETTEGVAADPDFRQAALAAGENFETDPFELSDGSIATLRVDAIVPPTLLPLEEVRDQVAADWRAERAAEVLTEAAGAWRAEIAEGASLEELAERLGARVETAGPLSRGDISAAAPPELVAEIFELEPGQATILPEPGGAILARLDRIEPFDPDADENQPVVVSVQAEFRRQIGDDMLAYVTRALQAEAGVSVNESLIQSTLAALP